MNMLSPILDGAAEAAEAVGSLLVSPLKAVGPGAGWLNDAADGGLGIAISGLAGVASALLVAILISVYLRTGYRSTRDVVIHGLAAVLALGLIAFATYDLRHDALAYLGLNASPTVHGTDLPTTGLLGGRIEPPARRSVWVEDSTI